MDIVLSSMDYFYKKLAENDEKNRREMRDLFEQTGKVEQDEKETDIVFGRASNEII